MLLKNTVDENGRAAVDVKGNSSDSVGDKNEMVTDS